MNYVESKASPIGILVFQCSNSLLCWTPTGLWHVLRDSLQQFSSTAAVPSDIFFTRKAEREVSRIMMLLAEIWHNQNSLIWNQRQLQPQHIIQAAHMNGKQSVAEVLMTIFEIPAEKVSGTLLRLM